MKKLKVTNTFYQTEPTDTRLRYSVSVPDDDKNAILEFKPIENFGFQENFKKTLGLSSIKEQDTKEYIRIYKPEEKRRRLNILSEISESLKILNNYDRACNDEYVKVYVPKNRR